MQSSIAEALEALLTERARVDGAIRTLEEVLGAVSEAPRAPRRGPGRPKNAAKRSARAPRGLLKEKIHSVLKAAAGPLSPTELCKGVISAGYPAKSPRSLYSAILAAVKKDHEIVRSKDGLSLGKAGVKPEKPKASKKSARKKRPGGAKKASKVKAEKKPAPQSASAEAKPEKAEAEGKK